MDANGNFSITVPLNTTVKLASVLQSGSWSKTLQTPSSGGSIIDLGTMELCENSLVGETSFILHGDGLENASFVVNTNKNNPGMNSARYEGSTSNLTNLKLADMSGQLKLSVIFEGQTTGTLDPTKVIFIIERNDGSSWVYYRAGKGRTGSELNVQINRYEAVGGVVEGTFSGTFLVYRNSVQVGTITISNGKFSALRYE
jgi:hypothetical protein